jgi:putative tricarboxylic transport membrane protein
MAPQGMRDRDQKELDATLAKVVQSAKWKEILQQRGWIDMYQPSAEFAAFLKEERPRIEGLLKDLGLA